MNYQWSYKKCFVACLGGSAILLMFICVNFDKVKVWSGTFPKPQTFQDRAVNPVPTTQLEGPNITHSTDPPLGRPRPQVQQVKQVSKPQQSGGPSLRTHVNRTVSPAPTTQLEGPKITHSNDPPLGQHRPQIQQVKQVSKPQQSGGPSLRTNVVEIFPHWTTTDPKDVHNTHRLYLYSAIVDIHQSPPDRTAVHIVGFQDERHVRKLTCCVKLSQSDKVYSEETATEDFAYPAMGNGRLKTFGMVHRCLFRFTSQELRGGHVTLSHTSCPGDVKQYLSIHHPVPRPGGLAVCAKVAYGFRLNPNTLVEWFEIQRILGVDRVQLFDLNNTETVRKVFRHYQDKGLLDLLPYKLPGKPWGRSILEKGTDYARFGDDEELILWDCRLRLAGYDYVMDIDLDEIIMPRRFDVLKPFLKEEFAKHTNAASLHFKVQMFLDNWGVVDPQAPLRFLRYLNSSLWPSGTEKLVYIPQRTHQAYTHDIRPYKGFVKIQFVPASEATIFHYRSCKMNWRVSCDRPRSTDTSMQRFRSELVPSVLSVQQQLGLDPS